MPTVKETAAALEVEPATIRSWVLHRKVVYRKIGRSVRIPREEIDRLLREGIVPARKDL